MDDSRTPGGTLERLGLHRPELRAWAMYDWANSAMVTVIITAVFPIFYKSVVADGLPVAVATSRYSLATGLALAVVAVLAPPLGAYADFRARRKRLLGWSVGLGTAAVAAMFFLSHGDWVWALVLFGLANIGAGVAQVFYDALLPHIASDVEVDRVSTAGYALGYLGGGIVLALDLLCILKPEWVGLPHGEGLTPNQELLPTRLAFLSVAVWWLVFTIPLLRGVPEPPASRPADVEPEASPIRASFRKLAETLGRLRTYRHAFLFLLAFLIYNDGILTIIRVAVLFGKALGIDEGALIGTVLLVQFVGIPFAFLFGHLATRFGTKRCIYAALCVYVGIALLAYSMTATWHFYALGLLVATVQGGAQGLSRSLFASMIPARDSGEFFAFFAMGEKFAGVLGPLLFGTVLALDTSEGNEALRRAILFVSLFFIVGMVLLTRVDVAAGRAAARE